MDVLRPVVDHGKGELPAGPDIKLRDADMEAGADRGVGGAAGDDMECGPGFDNHQVMDVLGEAVGAQIEAGLHRLGDFRPGQGPDEVAVVQLQFGRGGVFIGIHRHQTPEEVIGPNRNGLHGLGDGQHFHARLPGPAVHDGLVGLEKGAGMVLVGQFDAGSEEAAPLLGRKLAIVGIISPVAALTGKLLQVEIRPKGRLSFAGSSRRGFLSPTSGALLVTEVLEVME